MKDKILAAMLAVAMSVAGMEPEWRIFRQSTADIVVVDMDGEKVYLSHEDIIEEKKVGEWVYFRYMQESSDEHYDDYPVLCRYKENERMAKRVTEGSCYTYEIAGGSVYYLNSVIAFQDHGELYISEPDGKNTRMLEDELHDFQIVDEKYIYYTYRHDTYGVGLDGHALHRMNLDGSDKMIAAYEVSGADDISASHFRYKVVDGWVDCGAFKMELGEPADGYEKIVCKEIGDNDWIYYVTNRLMKARRDGSEQMELDGVCDYYYEVVKVADGWIYYYKGGMPYRIRTDGSGLETVTQKEMYSI